MRRTSACGLSACYLPRCQYSTTLSVRCSFSFAPCGSRVVRCACVRVCVRARACVCVQRGPTPKPRRQRSRHYDARQQRWGCSGCRQHSGAPASRRARDAQTERNGERQRERQLGQRCRRARHTQSFDGRRECGSDERAVDRRTATHTHTRTHTHTHARAQKEQYR